MKTDVTNNWPQGRGPNPAYCSEDERLTVMASYGVDKLMDDGELSAIVQFAAKLCGAPVSLVSLVEEQRQRFLARAGLDTTETPRPTSFCAHAMMEREPLVVPDAMLDPRFERNPLVTGEPKIRFYAGVPLLSSEGAPLGSLCVIDTEPRTEGLTDFQREGLEVLAASVMRRLNARREYLAVQEKLVRESMRLRKMAEHIPVLAWAANPDGSLEFGNEALYEYFGTNDLSTIDFEDMIHSSDAEAVETVREASRTKGQRWEAEARVRRADGEYRWMVLRAWPMRDAKGEIETWFGAGIDIDETHKLSQSRDLLARELSHRIKNIFAVVSGLLAMHARGLPDVQPFADKVSGAIRSLATAHDYVRPEDGTSSDNLGGLLEGLLAPYAKTDSDLVKVSGDDVFLGARAATPLALIFHELATNSAKYGALASERGTVQIEVIKDCDKKGSVCINWHEEVADFTPPSTDMDEGFGSRLLRMAIEGQLSGSFTREFSDSGLQVELIIPKSAISAK
ncbi:sensor histidine kinase [Qipengyuania psychrotolerans]|uniref:histidine kinase n=1 Tax=Qipengyuania psychrotolerans TaxID=2867238 RepID=A0ABX8ZD35_9SPHN|nr:GAF domain-containing protein [Qipengyuania psychrotolerans]QZD86814.1 PAS domain S-box protein [Qipengyuania psychrotolerans]